MLEMSDGDQIDVNLAQIGGWASRPCGRLTTMSVPETKQASGSELSECMQCTFRMSALS